LKATFVARANLLALESEFADDAFNVGTRTSTTLSQLRAVVLRLMGSELEPEYREARKRGDASVRRVAVEKAEKMLHFSARVGLEEGVGRLIAWRRAAKARNLDMTGCKV
jgi:UDP-glucose 4-epimerase